MHAKKLLLVEDDKAFVNLIKVALRDLNFEFEVAKDGPSALEFLSKTRFDLIISDYRLPHIHGLDIIKAAKQNSPNCQIVLISAAAAEMMESNLEDLPLLGFLQKPFSPLQLRDLIVKAL
ncbi:MAG: response regulator [bacterium]